MASQPIRVLFRGHLGVPYRTASDEEKGRYREQLKQIFAKWRSSGVKFVGVRKEIGSIMFTIKPHFVNMNHI